MLWWSHRICIYILVDDVGVCWSVILQTNGKTHSFLVGPRQTETAVNQPPSVLISPLQHVILPQLLLFMLLMKCWMGLFPPPLGYIFSRVANSRFLSFFSFLLLQFFAGVWLYVFSTADVVYGKQHQQGCFVWLKRVAAKYSIQCFASPYPPTKKWQNLVIERNTLFAHCCVYGDSIVGFSFIIYSAIAH